jgi:hypothetical protein
MTRPLEFLQVCPKIGINVWKMRSPISKPNLGILKQRIRQSRKESDAKFNFVRFEKNGPDSSSEAKVMTVLSLNSESVFLARCWKGGGSVLWIGSVLEIGSILWIGSVVEIGSILWIRSVLEIEFVLWICFGVSTPGGRWTDE